MLRTLLPTTPRSLLYHICMRRSHAFNCGMSPTHMRERSGWRVASGCFRSIIVWLNGGEKWGLRHWLVSFCWQVLVLIMTFPCHQMKNKSLCPNFHPLQSLSLRFPIRYGKPCFVPRFPFGSFHSSKGQRQTCQDRERESLARVVKHVNDFIHVRFELTCIKY